MITKWCEHRNILLSLCFCNLLVPTSSQDEHYDTIVVGLGSAGATAASTLAAAGQRVLALEAQNRIGGRVNTVKFGNGSVEMGAEWIHGDQHNVVYDAAIINNVTLLSQGLSLLSFFSDGTWPVKELIDDIFNRGLEIFGNATKSHKIESKGKYLKREVLRYIKETRPELLEQTDFIKEFILFLNLYLCTEEASEDLNDVTTASKYVQLEGDNIYNNGPGYRTLDIKLSKEVTRIVWSQDGVVVFCHDESVYTANNVIVTVSLGVLKERYSKLFIPKLPADKEAAIEMISMGVMNKVHLLFEEPFWPKEFLLLGFIWKMEQKSKIPPHDFWLTKTGGANTLMSSNNTLTLWFTGRAAKLIESLPEKELKQKSMLLLRMFLGKYNVTDPKEIIRSTWYSNIFTRGSFSYDGHIMAKYPESRSILARPLVDSSGVPRVLFAGEATNEIHFATVHGASETGYREARRILDNKL